ncbi:MAG: phosphopantetheine-binding protein [Verrucomicrobia bacterium]|nr:phosphopantetheine-binding protein [Verrucomicrobiota bacterium]
MSDVFGAERLSGADPRLPPGIRGSAPDTIREVVVSGQALPQGGHELVAYVVPANSPGPSVTVLRQKLADKLPDYMIPSHFVYLDHLPRAGNGKILRGQLTEQSPLEAPLDTSWLAPRTPLEKQIAGIWEEVLDLEHGELEDERGVGVQDNFFDLGGHSLRAIQVISRLRTTLSLEVPLRSLFDLPTLAEFAKEIERLAADTTLDSIDS